MADFAIEGSDLKKVIKAAKKRPVAFGFSPARADDGNYLGMHRSKPAATIGREAKAEGDGSKFAFGTAVVEAKIIRLTCERLMPGLAKRFKKHLKSQKVMLNVVILDIGGNVIESDIEEDLPDDPELDGDDDGEPDDAPPEKVDGDALGKRIAMLAEEVRALPPAFGGRLAGPFRQMLDLERSGDLEQAAVVADRLESALLLIDQHMAAKPGASQPDPSQQMLQLQKVAAGLRDKVAALPKGEAQAKLTLALDRADKNIALHETAAAVAALKVIDGILKTQGGATGSTASSSGAPGDPGGGPPDPNPPDPTPPDKPDDGEAERLRDLEERRKAAEILRGAIGRISAEGADEPERNRLRTAADLLTAGWGDPPSRDQLRAARDGLGPLQALADEIGQAVAGRRQARAVAADQVRALTVDNADKGETDEITAEQNAILKELLPDTPSGQQLKDAAARIDAQKLRSDQVRADVASRVERAAAILLAKVEAQKVTGATKDETDRLAAAGEKITGLDGFPSRDAIKSAGDALSDLEKLAVQVRAATEARARHAAEVDAVLKTLEWGKNALVPHAAAPSGLTDAVKQAVGKLAQDHDVYRDPGKVGQWATIDPAALADALKQLREAVAVQIEALAAINAAAQKVAEARAKVTATIEAAGIHPLSTAQKEALSKRADEAAALLATDIAEVGLAEAALAKVAKVASDATALQQALRGLRSRIEAVDLAPPLVSDAEKAALAALRKAAMDALAEVDA